MKFRITEKDNQGNITGPHRTGNKRYRAGQIVESDQPLDRLFKNKFELVPDNIPASKPEIVRTVTVTKPPISHLEKPAEDETGEDTPVSVQESEQVEDQESESKPKPRRSQYGKDVTEDFPDAVLLKLKVYYATRKNIYSVVDEEEGEKVVVKTSKSSKNVEKFLEKDLD